MSATSNSVPDTRRIKLYAVSIFAVVLLMLMALDTKVVTLSELESEVGFSPEQFAQDSFSDIREYIEANAVEASILAHEALQSPGDAGEQYGIASGIGHVIPVSVTGTAIEQQAGIYTLEVEGVSDEVVVRVQMGPAINGTVLRDTTGNIQFSDFTNQIEYQDAGAALNEEMKRQVLTGVSTQDLIGQTLSITGSFNMINPQNWLITPVNVVVDE
ncbi:DUF2291 family protein [Halomonas sp. HNIBRBA4712]|uniref:DUF2291 family protein n=1 Tax=Halomonas sp. HNIBRBA4712 TaxID=3373087 RepID=UPI003746086C